MKSFLCLSALVVCGVTGLDFSLISSVASAAVVANAKAVPTSTIPGGAAASPASELLIPGPLRSLLRMAGISQQISRDDVFPLLAWNVSTLGYQGGDHPTEYLILLTRYVAQARELAALAGSEGVIRVSGCEDAAPLLHILGYRIVSKCGQPQTSLLTADAERAFLTMDSGFPLTELEQTVEGGKPFEYTFASTRVPILFSEREWIAAGKKNRRDSKELVDAVLSDHSIARLYWALSKMDPETRNYLQRSLGIRNLVPYGALLDFYGSHICIRRGRVVLPGAPEADSTWEGLVGASPVTPADFIPRLLSKDKGWLVAYFDVLATVSRRQAVYFTNAQRLQRFFAAMPTPTPSTSATSGVFRPAPWLFLLVSQTQWDPRGEPLVPGGIEIWREILPRWKDASRALRERGRSPIKNAEDLMEDMFAISRESTEDGPLQAYLALSELDSRRSPGHALAPETVRLMCLKFGDFSDQYRIFSEFPQLSDASILLFLDIAERVGKIANPARSDALGIIQANIGIWQILARQGQIPTLQLDESWQNVVKPFSRVRSASQVYDAGRISLARLFRSVTGSSAVSQDGIVGLLAGPQQNAAEGKKVHRDLADKINSVLDGQRLVSLDTLIALGDALGEKADGKPPEEYLLHMAGELHEFQMPQPIFTNSERTEWAASIYNNHHTDLEMRTNVGGVLKSTKASRAQLEEARGQLTPFLRDILVGLNYAYYEPPGAQALHNNPLFVRSHDFSGETVEGIKGIWQAPQLFGAGNPAGGGAHFVGSMADLPYVLAELEQDFIAPRNVQALIWQELVPTLLASAVLPRWWTVSPEELHAVTLYQQAGEELLTTSARDEKLRVKVMTILSDRILPRRSEKIEQTLRSGQPSEILADFTPADAFYLTGEFERRYPEETGSLGTAGQELRDLRLLHPEAVNWNRLSQDFGIPHPTLSYTYGLELLNVPPLPAFSGFASRLLAESWDSSNLYWARLADETGYPPVALNQLVPELTREMVERIFATDLEDWPAILRAMRETGEGFRKRNVASLTSIRDARPEDSNSRQKVQRVTRH
ncbi:MAG: hypothetical protein WB683_11065 [Candidatus Sulfotelmatobacter sp.]